jgi:hypothetical protein
MSPTLWLFPIATSYVISRVIKRCVSTQKAVEASLLLFALVLLCAIYLGAAVYLAKPSFDSVVIAIWVNLGALTLGLLPLFRAFIRSYLVEKSESVRISKGLFYAAIISLVLFINFLVSLVLELITGLKSFTLTSFIEIVTSVWFIGAMSFQIVFTTLLFRGELRKPVFSATLLQALSIALSPTLLKFLGEVSVVPEFAIISISVLHIFRNKNETNEGIQFYFNTLLLAFILVATGSVFWEFTSNAVLLGFSIVFSGTLYLWLALYHREFVYFKRRFNFLPLRRFERSQIFLIRNSYKSFFFG